MADEKTIVVIGDVTLDWLQEEIPRSQTGGERHNYELYPGFRWTPVWGGAALVERLLNAAINTSPSPGAQFKFDGVNARLSDKMITENAPEFLQSLAIVKEVVEEATEDQKGPIRVDSFRGFMEASVKPKDRKKLYPTEVSSLACIVVDDAANGCRDDKDFADNLMKLAADAPLIVVKLNRPLDHNDLTKKLADLNPKSERRIIIVVNADDLRDQGLDISRRLSWERSAIDLILAANTSPILRDLSKIGDVVARFGNDGCAVLERNNQPCLVFDPRRAEDTYNLDLGGTMPGATSAFTAYVTASLLQQPAIPLRLALPLALCASRRLLKRGFHTHETTRQPIDYPLHVFRETDKPKIENDFVTIDLPARDASPDLLKDWSILTANPPEPDHALSLAKDIVRDGHKDHLKQVPVAEFGKLLLIDRREIEGYRSIENLLREYIKSRHGKKPRPLSIGVFGPPGSGKSFGIKEIAGCIKETEIRILPFNLTQFDKPSDLIGALRTARDETLKGRFPLLIFDEFDCPFESDRWGWLKFFLAPMQDGEFNDNGRIHPIGNAIFVFAGGIAYTFEDFAKPKNASSQTDVESNSTPPAESNSKPSTETNSSAPVQSGSKSAEDSDFKKAKVPDFASRLKGYVNVAGINPPFIDHLDDPQLEGIEPDSVCMVRRAILLRSLLFDQEHRTRNMNPITKGKNRLDIDDAVLNALLRATRYRYGARSLESILIMSRLTDRDYFGVASLPSDEQLKIHVDGSFVKILKKR